jgi:hypothetical protein
MLRKLMARFRKEWHRDFEIEWGYKLDAIMKMLCKSDEDELSVLCDIYGSDKGSISRTKYVHSYTSVYHELFSPIRDKVESVFECGIGTNNPNLPSTMGIYGRPGASLRVWRDYFKHAIIVGGDIDKDILFEEDRIHTAFLNQLDAEEIKRFFSSLEPNYPNRFDIMIDDGLHTSEAAICLLKNSFPYLKSGGIYVIEDMSEQNTQDIKAWIQKNLSDDTVTVDYKRTVTKWMFDINLVILKKHPN